MPTPKPLSPPGLAPDPVAPSSCLGGNRPEIAVAGVWRGAEIGRQPSAVVPTGWAQLDRELPGGGWPSRAITEVLTPQPATTEWRLLGPALRQVAARGGSIIAVAPPREPYLPGLRQAGLDERGFVWIEARTLAERLWATEQLIRANASSDALHGLATWALQFTPRVAIADEAVLLEVAASTRLFGGRRALHERISSEARTLGAVALAWAPNSLAALACARAGVLNGVRLPLPEVLDALALHVLSATRPHQLTLAQLGCRTLGEVRRLPRGGLTRRFGQALLQALDQAYGLRPEAHGWIALPEVFRARLELMSRVETAPALLFGARRLLVQLCGWLAVRHAGITAFTLHWAHDASCPSST